MTQEYFHKVIERVLEILGEDCKRNPDCYRKSGEEFEPLVVQAVKRAIYDEEVAVRVDYIPGGHRFPDIVLVDENGAKFGIEVKSSTGRGRSWKINGNSVMGTTKVSGLIENVIVFGKLHGENSEFRAKNYEQSISSVGVTHSPRFLIDMELPEGESFFDKSGITYAQLDSSDNPIKRITDYFLSIGQKAWWLAESTPATIRMFSDLSRYEQDHLMGYAFVHFPEIFSDSSSKFYRYMSWLVSEKGVVDAALRDRFTAGGRINLILGTKEYHGIPHIFGNMSRYKGHILMELKNSDLDKLSEDWGIEASANYRDRILQLKDIICNNISDNNLVEIDKFELVEDILNIE